MNTTPAIVLKREDFRERDERIVFYTRNFGKLSIVARGARRIEAKLRGALDIFNALDITFVEGTGFNILTNLNIRNRFHNIGRNEHNYRASLSAALLVCDIFEERFADPYFFDDMYIFLSKLDCSRGEKDSKEALKDFQIQFLQNQGYGVETPSNDIMEPENSITRAFSYSLGYKIQPW